MVGVPDRLHFSTAGVIRTNTSVFQLSQPGTFADPLTDILRAGAW